MGKIKQPKKSLEASSKERTVEGKFTKQKKLKEKSLDELKEKAVKKIMDLDERKEQYAKLIKLNKEQLDKLKSEDPLREELKKLLQKVKERNAPSAKHPLSLQITDVVPFSKKKESDFKVENFDKLLFKKVLHTSNMHTVRKLKEMELDMAELYGRIQSLADSQVTEDSNLIKIHSRFKETVENAQVALADVSTKPYSMDRLVDQIMQVRSSAENVISSAINMNNAYALGTNNIKNLSMKQTKLIEKYNDTIEILKDHPVDELLLMFLKAQLDERPDYKEALVGTTGQKVSVVKSIEAKKLKKEKKEEKEQKKQEEALEEGADTIKEEVEQEE